MTDQLNPSSSAVAPSRPAGATTRSGKTGGGSAPPQVPGDGSTAEVRQRAARNVAMVTAAEIIGKLGSLAFLVVGARALSRADFGAFSYSFAFAGLTSSILIWGFDSVVVREASSTPERLRQVVAETYLWRVFVGVPAFAIVGALGVFTRPSGTSAVALLMILAAFLVDTAMRTAWAGAEALQRIGRAALSQLVNRVLTAVLGIAALAVGFGLGGYSGAYLAGSVCGAVALVVAVRPLGVRADFSAVSRRSFLQLGKASVPLGIDGVIAMGLFKLDAVLVAALRGNSALAVYAVSYRLLETALFVAFAVVAALFAVMSASDSLQRIRATVERGLTVGAAVYVPFAIAVAFRGSGILRIMFGAQYATPAAAPLAWLGPTPLFIAFGNLATVALVARHRMKGAVLSSLAALVANVILNLALIPSMGPTGAAIANTAAYAFEAVILAVLCTRLFGFPRIDRALLEALGAGAAMAVALLVVHVDTVADLLIGTLVFGLVWLALSARFAPRNLDVLRSFVRRGPAVELAPIVWRLAEVESAPAVAWRLEDVEPNGSGTEMGGPITWRSP